jgi:hypothetical protein
MIRKLILIAGAGLLTLPVAAQSAGPPRASAQLNRCHPALDSAQRWAVFGGTMRSLQGGQDRLEMRFDLYRRPGGAAIFRRVAAPGLGVWNRANAGVGRFKFHQKVENLSAPAAYRAVVSFRWIGANGRVFLRAQHVTPACLEPDLRPDLSIGRISGSRVTGSPGKLNYDVTVHNGGASAARGFDVGLNVGRTPVVPSRTVGLLRAGEKVVLEFTGPRCAVGSPVVATADTGGLVAESNETNNSMTVSCPAIGIKSSH